MIESMMQPYYSIVLPIFAWYFAMFYIYNALIIFVLYFKGIFGCKIKKEVN
jgi:hypothetical protein